MTAYAVVNSKTCSCERAKIKPPYIQISAKSIVGQTVTRPLLDFGGIYLICLVAKVIYKILVALTEFAKSPGLYITLRKKAIGIVNFVKHFQNFIDDTMI